MPMSWAGTCSTPPAVPGSKAHRPVPVRPDQRIDPYLGTVVHVVGASRRCPASRRPAARSASADSKRPFHTTSTGSRTGGRPWRAIAARWSCTHRNTTPRSGHSDETVCARSSICGHNAPKRSAGATTSTLSSSSRTAAPRWGRRSPTRMVRSTRTTTSPVVRHRCLPRAGSRKPTAGIGWWRVPAGGWRAFPRHRRFRSQSTIAPETQVPDLPSVDDDGRDGLAMMLVDLFARLDRLTARPCPT